ncbi:SET domain-containing protein [Colletotrichum navitas]|uniref:SET domain-containing protein n=1 Tax=Colletotrichum navitas TaxID=681940 RepID=A0AAD8UZU7_9PEZI|nr:SET domain-containing protein [Colletotrichum navitas]KAK1574047.1 SET domain-containing protein [Colletotrichum navitas]
MEELVRWATSHGAALHPSVEVYDDPNTGNSFRASPGGPGVKPGETVVTCPMDLTLSYLNAITTPSPGFHHENNKDDGDDNDTTDSSSPFPPAFLASVPPHVIGRFFLIHQYLLGKASFWHPYISTLPQPEHLQSWILPPLWPSDDIELLEDTNVHVAVAETKARLKAEYKHAVAALGDDSAAARRGYTRLLYHWAYCIFASRSFRPSLVIPAARKATLALPEGCAVDDFSLLMPLLDVGNHAPTAAVTWDTDAGGNGASNSCALRTLDPYAPGAQVFNNYGTSKTNAELMLAYGFCVPESAGLHNDYVHVQKRGAAAAAAAAGGADAAKAMDYLISLRPVADPSSAAARAVRMLADVDGARVLPPFRHVQDTMVWDLVLAQTTAEQREAMLPVSEAAGADADLERLRKVLTGDAPAAFRPVLFQTVAIIQDKVLQELERLDQSEFEMEEAGATRNQLMAYHYRRQCRKVLENVLESMVLPEELS